MLNLFQKVNVKRGRGRGFGISFEIQVTQCRLLSAYFSMRQIATELGARLLQLHEIPRTNRRFHALQCEVEKKTMWDKGAADEGAITARLIALEERRQIVAEHDNGSSNASMLVSSANDFSVCRCAGVPREHVSTRHTCASN